MAAVAIVALVAVIVGQTNLRGGLRTFIASTDVYLTMVIAAAVGCSLRIAITPVERLPWGMVAVALWAWAGGEVLFSSEESVRGFLVSDISFLLFYLFAFAGVVLLYHARFRKKTRFLWLDTSIGTLALASFVVAVYGSLDPSQAGSNLGYLPTFAFPIADLSLLLLITSIATVGRARFRGDLLLVGVAFGLCAIADISYAIETADGGGRGIGLSLNALWPLGMISLAAAALYAVSTPRSRARELRPVPVLLFPAALSPAALGVLVYDHYEQVSIGGLILATASIAALIVRLLLSLRDVQKEQAERLRVQELVAGVERMKSLGELSSSVAHDFNNILSVITNASELAAHELDNPAQVRSDLAEISDAAKRGREITRQLLTFSRAEDGAPQRVAVDSILEMAPLLDRAVGIDIELRIEIGEHCPALALRPGQLSQILLNLVVNSGHAMPDGGEVSIIAAPSAAPGGNGQPAGTLLLVRDTGVGMSEATVERAVEPFFSTKSHEQGTGLGLSTVYGIVSGAGGEITIDSVPGVGSKIHIWLPAFSAEEKVASAVT